MWLAMFRWKDAALHGQTTKFYDDIQGLSRVTLITVGIVVKQDNEEITLCMDYSPTEVSWRSCQTYPKSCIEIIKTLRIPNHIYPHHTSYDPRDGQIGADPIEEEVSQ